MGGKSSTTTSTTKLPPEITAAYKGLLAQATPISQTPYQAYAGGVGGSGMEANQNTGFNSIANLNGASNGDFNAAAGNYGNATGALNSTATPTSASVGQYMSPYISGVVNSTMANMNEQNAEQQQGVLGNAAAQGALGGNRVGVAQSELARQQNLANQQTIAGLYNTGYNTALGAAQSDKQAALQAAQGYSGVAQGYSNLGQTAMQTNLAQAAAQVGAGTQQQQWNYQQYQNAKSYPFETTSWLANIAEGLGSGQGTTTTKAPSGNTGSSILGGVLGLGSLFLNEGGAVHGRPQRAQGGVIPYSSPSGIVSANNNNPPASNDNGYVPQVAAAAVGHPGPPPTSAQPGQDSGAQMLNQGTQAMEKAVQQKYPNGILAGAAPTAGVSAPPIASSAAASPGLLSSIGSFLGLANGGVARRHYDVGGYVDPTDSTGFDASSISPADLLALLHTTTPIAATPVDSGVAPKTDRIPAPTENLADRFGATDAGPPVVGTGNLASALAASNAPAPDASMDNSPSAPSGGVIPVPTPRPDHYVDPQVVTQDYSSGVAPPLPPPTDVKDYPVAGVVAPTAGNSMPSPGVVPTNTASKLNIPINGASQGIYDTFMNTVRQGVTLKDGSKVAITNPYGLAAVASTGTAESGFSPGNTYGSWADPAQHGQPGQAGGIMSWRADRLANMRSFVGSHGGDPNHPSPDLQAQFFLQEDPSLVQGLNNAKSPAEAQQLMNNAWKFAGYNQQGGEAGRRIAMANNIAPQFEGSTNGTVASSGPSSPGVDSTTTGSTGSASSGVVAPPAQTDDPRGVLSSIMHGERPHLSNDMRMALLSAGLGMMAGTSPNFGTNVGTGGLKGMETYMAKQQLNRENALAQSEIATRAGGLNLEGKRVDIAGQQLALEAKKNAADIGQTTAQTAKTGVETAAQRYQTQYTPAGLMVRDVTRPDLAPHVISYDELQNGALMPDGSPIPSPAQAAASSKPAAAAERPQSAPVTAAPVTPVGPVPQGTQQAPANQSIFTTQAPAKIPIDPRMMQPAGGVGPSTVVPETTDALKQARTNYQSATAMQTQLGEMQHDLAALPASAMTKQGSGFGSRVQIAKTINTALSMAHMQPWFDENAVAAGEDLNKQTNKLGFNLSSTLGSGEAASIIEKAVSSVPSGANSPEGAQRIIAGIQAGNQRNMDYYQFLQDWAGKSGGSIRGADQAFNAANPPELYAIASYVPAPAIQALRAHPETANVFEQKYGAGTAKYVLNRQ